MDSSNLQKKTPKMCQATFLLHLSLMESKSYFSLFFYELWEFWVNDTYYPSSLSFGLFTTIIQLNYS